MLAAFFGFFSIKPPGGLHCRPREIAPSRREHVHTKLSRVAPQDWPCARTWAGLPRVSPEATGSERVVDVEFSFKKALQTFCICGCWFRDVRVPALSTGWCSAVLSEEGVHTRNDNERVRNDIAETLQKDVSSDTRIFVIVAFTPQPFEECLRYTPSLWCCVVSGVGVTSGCVFHARSAHATA